MTTNMPFGDVLEAADGKCAAVTADELMREIMQ